MHHSLSVGNELRIARESLGLSYRDMADITKIQPGFLRYIEEERFDELPAEVYLRGFIRSYARELRLNEQEILDLYIEQTGQKVVRDVPTVSEDLSPTLEEQSRLARFANQSTLNRYAYGLGIAAVVLIATMAVLMFSGGDANDEASANYRSDWNVESWQPAVESSDEWRQ